MSASSFSLTGGFHPLWLAFPKTILLNLLNQFQRSDPSAVAPVWALSISLAATLEITCCFSSSSCLDVSVHRVPLLTLWIGVRITEDCSVRFPHSEISGSMDICSSPCSFRSLSVFHWLFGARHPIRSCGITS